MSTPCYNTIAANNYDRRICEQEAKEKAVSRHVDTLMDDWSINDLYQHLKPHQQEMIDEAMNEIAQKDLEERAADSFVEPDFDHCF